MNTQNLRTAKHNFYAIFNAAVEEKGGAERELLKEIMKNDSFVCLVTNTAFFLEQRDKNATLQDLVNVFSRSVEKLSQLQAEIFPCRVKEGDTSITRENVLLSNDFAELEKNPEKWALYRFVVKSLIGKSKTPLSDLTNH